MAAHNVTTFGFVRSENRDGNLFRAGAHGKKPGQGMMRRLGTALATALFAFAPGGAWSADEAQSFADTSVVANYDFFVGGFRIAEVHLTANADSETYDASSRIATRGVLDVILRGRSASQAQGTRGAFGRLSPIGFTTRYKSRSGEQTIQIGYRDATPEQVLFEPEPEDDIPHAVAKNQRGSLDPLSGAVAALLPSNSADLCNRTIPIFDGKRRFDIIFLAPDPARFDASAPEPEWDRPLTRCLGIYERISGFDPESLEAERYFPFDIWFEDSGESVFRAVRIAGKTKLGFAIGNLRTE